MSVSQPSTSSQGSQTAAAGLVPAGAAAGGAAGAAGATVASAAALSAGGAVVAAGVASAFLAFLVAVREAHRRWMLGHLGRYGATPVEIADAIAREMRLEELYAQAALDRLSAKLPAALAVADPAQRAAAVRAVLLEEQRYAQQREEAMAARAIAAVTRARLRRESPLGAFWRLGRAVDHTSGCVVMAGGDYDGAGRFWPWAVLDRVHPPRHYGCTSTLHSFGEAIAQGWMTAGDVPEVRDAIRAAAGVVMEQEDADALLRELDLRDALSERGIDTSMVPFEGLGEAFDAELHPRDFRGRWADKLTGLGVKLGGDWKGNTAAMEDAAQGAHAVLSRYDLPEVKSIEIAPYIDESGRFASKSHTTVDLSSRVLDDKFMAARHADFKGMLVTVPGDRVGLVRTVTHELGHVLDGELLRRDRKAYDRLTAFLNEKGSYGMPGERTRLQAGLEAPSPYGTENRYEFVAEALTDWIHNGEKAHPSSVFIGKLFDEEMGKKKATTTKGGA